MHHSSALQGPEGVSHVSVVIRLCTADSTPEGVNNHEGVLMLFDGCIQSLYAAIGEPWPRRLKVNRGP